MTSRVKNHGWLAIGLILGLTACGSTPVHEQEAFSIDSPFQRRIPRLLDQACEGARLALLSQGYTLDDSRAHRLKGTKIFQPDEEEHASLEFEVVCAMTRRGATLYANAIETRYDLKKNQQAAGISIASVGSISMPWGSSGESLIKTGGKTVTDTTFYERFFDLVEQQLGITPSRNSE